MYIFQFFQWETNAQPSIATFSIVENPILIIFLIACDTLLKTPILELTDDARNGGSGES